MVEIKRYEEKYKEDVRFVCCNSDGPCDWSEKKRHIILTTYCDYFIEKEGHNCFVAVDENDKAVGYILCAENYDKFKKIFKKEYLPRLKKYTVSDRIAAVLSTFIQAMLRKKYPAHMHIDILPEYQRMGLGHRLMDALCENLRKKGVKGVCLTMFANNEKGGNFYRKYGFTLLKTFFSTAIFALEL